MKFEYPYVSRYESCIDSAELQTETQEPVTSFSKCQCFVFDISPNAFPRKNCYPELSADGILCSIPGDIGLTFHGDIGSI